MAHSLGAPTEVVYGEGITVVAYAHYTRRYIITIDIETEAIMSIGRGWGTLNDRACIGIIVSGD